MELLNILFVCDYTTSHNGNLGPMSESRMRIRVVKAVAVLRLLRGTMSPSGSRDVKRKERKGGVSDSTDLNFSVHTHSQMRPLSVLCLVSKGLMKLHIHMKVQAHIIFDIIHS